MEQRNQIIGLGENSFKKSYYPELQSKITELEDSYRNLNAIFNRINDGIIIHDEKGKLILLNEHAQKILNIKDEDKDNYLIIEHIGDHINPEELYQIWTKVLNGESKIIDLRLIQEQTGLEIVTQVSLNKAFWYGKNVIVAVLRDFTERIKFENEIIAAKEKAEESDRLKTAFLQNISHEIRTPMNGILGFMQLLKEPDLSAEARNEYIDIVNISGRRLLDTINDIVEISKIDTEQLGVQLSEVNVSEVLNYCIQSFEIHAIEKGLTINIASNLRTEQAIILTDKFKLEGILSNLIKNAIKFTIQGKIEIGYFINANSIVFFVKDSGVGIPANRLEAVFERFVQADLENTRPYEGSGLGLSIVKAYLDALEGKIWIDSEIGKGSTFYFSIPYSPINKKIEKQKSNEEIQNSFQKKITVLIAEDDEISYRYLERILSRDDIVLIWATNGEEAIGVAQLHPEISIILMDIKMPGINGFDATRQIRVFNKHIPIIVQTAYALPDYKDKAIEAGCNDFMSKPVNRKMLYELIKKFINFEMS